MRQFADRHEAGRALAALLDDYRGSDAVALGLPRGGVPVAAEVAKALDLPLDVLLVRKLGVPFQPELAMGAVGEGQVVVWNEDLVARLRLDDRTCDAALARERAEIDERAARYRPHQTSVRLRGRTALVIDDGIATGATTRAAVAVAREAGARKVVVATPVVSGRTFRELVDEVDDVQAVLVTDNFSSVGGFYRDFTPTSEREVVRLLRRGA